MQYPGFCGGSAPHRSLNVNAERAVNFFPEIVEPGTPKSRLIDMHTPGLEPYVQFAESPVRALFEQDDRVFAVAGDKFYEITGENAATLYGTVGTDASDSPVIIASNGRPGHQLCFVSNNLGWIFDINTNTLTQITDINFPVNVTTIEFVDGYFVAMDGAESKIYLSELFDGTSWDGLMVAQRSLSSDDIAMVSVVHRDIWIFGTKHTEVWYNSGATFPFQPISSVGVIDQGCQAPFSVQRMDNSVMWLGSDERGGVVVYRAEGYTPQRVSTTAMEATLSAFADVRDAMAWTYQQDGHVFYVLMFPTGPAATSGIDHTSWVYDVTTNLWHERADWNTTTSVWEPHRARCHCYDRTHQIHLVGDRLTGAVYRMGMDLYDERLVLV